jgi:transposase
VVAAADGEANAAIARQVGVGVDTVRKWRKRFVADRLSGLRDAARPGRPRRLPDAVRAEVIAFRQRVAAFETRYNAIAQPFNWRFTSSDLDDLLDRLPAPTDRNDHPLAA